MPGNFQYRLLHHDVTPPPAAWENISQQLNLEFDPVEISLSQKLYELEISPPEGSWDNILVNLDTDFRKAGQGKTIPLTFPRFAVAALVMGIIGLSLLYWFYTGGKFGVSGTGQAVSSLNPVNEADIQPSMPFLKKVLSQRKNSTILPSEMIMVTNSRRVPLSVLSSLNKKTYLPPLFQNTIHANPNTMKASDLFHPAPISAPPIRDEYGNIIMDVSLISPPNSNYIIVTGPNGSQTRISSKFLHCLKYLNGDNQNVADYNQEGLQWKNRFQEWRDKLLQQAGYIPTASNFFDIFELNELIQER